MSCKNNRKVHKDMIAQGVMTPEQVNRFTAKAAFKRGADSAYELYVNAILSGPITHGVNVASNAILTTWAPTQQFLEGASAFARRDFDKASVDFAKSKKMFVGLVEGVTDIFRLYNKHNQGDPTRMGYDDSIQIGSEKLKQRHKPSIVSDRDDLLGALVNRTGAFVRLPGNALLAEDKWFKMIHYRMQTNSAAVELAMKSSNDVQVQKNMYNFHKNNPDDTAIQTAKQQGEYYTFTEQLGKHGRKGSSWLRGIPGARYMFPFINTPTNIVKMGLNHGIYGNVTKDLKVALSAGSTAAEKDAARAKIAMGTFAPMAIMSLMGEDTLTGRIDMSTSEGRFKASQGKPPYSMRVGDTWYSYEKIEPFRSIVGLYATMRDAYTNIEHFDPDTGEPNPLLDQITFAGIAPILQTIGDNYLMNEIGGTLEILTSLSVGNPDTFGETLTRVAANMTVPAGIRQINKSMFDDTFRQADGYVQSVLQGIPGYSQELPARRTIWGDEQHQPEGLFLDIISPVYTASVKQDEIDRHIIDLEVDIPNVPRSISFFGGEGQDSINVDLTPQQREMFSVIRGKGLDASQPTLKASINQAYNDPFYQKASDIDKRIFIKNMMSTYHKMAVESLKQLPEVQDLYNKNLQLREAQRARTAQ